MRLEDQGGIGGNRFAHERREVIEMQLFDDHAAEEKTLCGADAAAEDRRSVRGYLEDRLNGIGVGITCEACKQQAIPFAQAMARDREAEGLADDAEDFHRLAVTLQTETGQSPLGPVEDRPRSLHL